MLKDFWSILAALYTRLVILKAEKDLGMRMLYN